MTRGTHMKSLTVILIEYCHMFYCVLSLLLFRFLCTNPVFSRLLISPICLIPFRVTCDMSGLLILLKETEQLCPLTIPYDRRVNLFLPIFLLSHPMRLCRCSPHRWRTGRCERWGRRSGRPPSPRRTGCWRSWRHRELGCSCCAWWANTAALAPSVCPRTSRRTWGQRRPGRETRPSGWRRGGGNASAAGMPSYQGKRRVWGGPWAGWGKVCMEKDSQQQWWGWDMHYFTQKNKNKKATCQHSVLNVWQGEWVAQVFQCLSTWLQVHLHSCMSLKISPACY